MAKLKAWHNLNYFTFIGVDPGTDGHSSIGALNYYYEKDEIKIKALFVAPNETKELNQVYETNGKYGFNKTNTFVYLEDKLFFAKQSHKNQFKYIENFYQHKTLISLNELQNFIVHPLRWKNLYKLNGNKDNSINAALKIVDNCIMEGDPYVNLIKRDHNKSEAFLIAFYGLLNMLSLKKIESRFLQ